MIDKEKLIAWLNKEIAMTAFYKNSEMQAVTIALQTVLKEVKSGVFDKEVTP
jgi:hypothetical protein